MRLSVAGSQIQLEILALGLLNGVGSFHAFSLQRAAGLQFGNCFVRSLKAVILLEHPDPDVMYDSVVIILVSLVVVIEADMRPEVLLGSITACSVALHRLSFILEYATV